MRPLEVLGYIRNTREHGGNVSLFLPKGKETFACENYDVLHFEITSVYFKLWHGRIKTKLIESRPDCLTFRIVLLNYLHSNLRWPKLLLHKIKLFIFV